MFSINPVLDTAFSRKAAERIAQGTRIVRRDANPKRSYAITFEHLAKLGPINAVHLQELISCFSTMIRGSQTSGATKANDTPREFNAAILNRAPSCTVLGLTESGIVPSFAMQKACETLGIRSEWCCSSRSDTGGLKFWESHSHAPVHFLPRNFPDRLGEELWIVEDEVTTGRTITNLLECIYEASKIRKCRVFTLLDAREDADRERLDNLCHSRGWDVTFQSILRQDGACGPFKKPRDFTTKAHPLSRKFVVGESIAAALPSLLSGDLQFLQHITLSPWAIDGEHIVSRQAWNNFYYIYNASEDGPKQIWNKHA